MTPGLSPSRLGHVLAWPARQPVAALLLALVVVAACTWSIARLRPAASITDLMGKGSPAVDALAQVTERFSGLEELLLLVTMEADMPADQAAHQLREFALRFESEAARPPLRDLTHSIRWRAASGERAFVEQVIAPNAGWYLTPAQMNELKHRLSPAAMREQIRQNEAMLAIPGPGAGALAKVLLQDPLRLREFLSQQLGSMMGSVQLWPGDALIAADGKSLLIRIAGQRPPSDLDNARQLTTAVRAAAERAGASGLKLDLAGGHAIAVASEAAIRSDMISNVIGSVLLLQLSFLIMYRKLASFPLAIAPVAMGIVVGFGWFALLRGTITPLVAVCGGLLAGMGVDYSIHYLSHHTQRRSEGDTAQQAAAHFAQGTLGALIGACGTTVASLAAMFVSPLQSVRDFAVIASLGLVGVLLAVLLVMPALLALLELRGSSAGSQPRSDLRIDLQLAVTFLAQRSRLLVTGMMLVGIASGVWWAYGYISRGTPFAFEGDLSVMHPQPNAPMQTHQVITQKFGGSSELLLVHLKAANPDALLSLAHRARRTLELSDAAAPAASLNLAAHTLVDHTLSLASWLPDPDSLEARKQELLAVDVDAVLRDFQAALSESDFAPGIHDKYEIFLRHVLRESQPPGMQDLERHPAVAEVLLPRSTPAATACESVMFVFLAKPLDTSKARAEAVHTLRTALASLQGATLTGLSVVGHDLEASLLGDVERMTGLGSVGIVLWLVVQLRRPSRVLLCLLPTIFGMSVLGAYMELWGEKLNAINLLALPLLVGIGVDNGIFLVAAAAHAASPAALQREMGAKSHAMIMASVTTALAYGTLVTTSMPALASFGRVMAVGVSTTLLGSMLLLSPLLLLLSPAKDASGES